jgi:hypothetical protein
MVMAKVSRMKENAAAPIAPANTGVHCKNLFCPPSTGVTVSMLIGAPYRKPNSDRMAMMTTIRPTR